MSQDRRHQNVTFAVLTTGVSAYSVLQSLVIPVLPTIQHSLHTSQSAVTWVLTAYLLSASIFTPILGRIGDIVGKKRTLIVALAALAIGSVVCALAGSIGVMIVGRAVQGVGGGVLPLAFGIVRDEFAADRVAGRIGNLASTLAVGGGLGTVLAGPLVSALDVHWLFWLPAILIALSAVAAAVMVPESPTRGSGRISVLPALLLSAWLVCGLVALSEAPTWGWAAPTTIALFVAAVLGIAAWVVSELRAASPLIDMRMMKLPAVWTTNVVSVLVGVAMYATFAFLPEFVQTPRSSGYGFGATITQSGLILLPSSVAMFVVGLYCGRLVAGLGAKVTIVIGSIVSTISMVLLTAAHHTKPELYLVTVILGLGFGLSFSAMSSLIVDAVPPSQTGVASGMNANIRTIGGSIGAALMATVVTAGTPSGHIPHESGYTAGFGMLAGACALSAIAALAIPRLPHRVPTIDEQPHPELAILAGGTVVGDLPE